MGRSRRGLGHKQLKRREDRLREQQREQAGDGGPSEQIARNQLAVNGVLQTPPRGQRGQARDALLWSRHRVLFGAWTVTLPPARPHSDAVPEKNPKIEEIGKEAAIRHISPDVRHKVCQCRRDRVPAQHILIEVVQSNEEHREQEGGDGNEGTSPEQGVARHDQQQDKAEPKVHQCRRTEDAQYYLRLITVAQIAGDGKHGDSAADNEDEVAGRILLGQVAPVEGIRCSGGRLRA